MLIDDYMPVFDVNELHHTTVCAPAGAVYAAVWESDLSDSKLTRLLFRLRALSAPPPRLTLDDITKTRFFKLAERPGIEIVIGTIGRFWRMRADTCRVSSAAFRDFDEPYYAKAAMNFHIASHASGTVRLTTETRVQCTDRASRLRFRLYWSVIGRFSGLIRREMLRTIKRNAENSHQHQPAHAR